MEELWKVIEGTNNSYEISSFGRVRKNGIIYRDGICKSTGYHQISIGFTFGRKVCKVHRLVALSFCEVPSNYEELQVNHIDGNKDNNVYTNLEWCTAKENQRHRIEVLGKNMKGSNNPMYGVSGVQSPVFKGYIYQVDPTSLEIVGIHAGSGEAAKVVNKRACNIIRAITTGRPYCGYFWRREGQ